MESRSRSKISSLRGCYVLLPFIRIFTWSNVLGVVTHVFPLTVFDESFSAKMHNGENLRTVKINFNSPCLKRLYYWVRKSRRVSTCVNNTQTLQISCCCIWKKTSKDVSLYGIDNFWEYQEITQNSAKEADVPVGIIAEQIRNAIQRSYPMSHHKL
jgi:hypothetical protein